MKPQMNTVQPSRNQKTHREDAKNAKFLKSLFFVSSRWISRCPSRGEFLDFRAAEAYDTPELRRD